MKFSSFLYLVIVFYNILQIQCTNLLFISSVASKSHLLWTKTLIGGLLKSNKSYNITVITPDFDDKPLPNMHYIHLERAYEALYSNELNLLEMSEDTKINTLIGLYVYSLLICEGMLKSEGLQTILNYPDNFKFDIIIYDFLCGPCILPLMHKFGYPPLIGATAFSNPIFKVDLIGGHLYPSYVPHYALGYGTNMNFFQKVYNVFFYNVESVYRNYFFMPKIKKIVNDRFKFDDMPPLEELERKMVLMLLNQHPSIDTPEPMQPNIVQVGGLQIVEPKPLPTDIQQFIESGKEGTVLMSLGTNIRSDMLGNETLINIIETFNDIPDYNFLWKFESDDIPAELSKNIKVLKFLPQNSILAHPKIKAFITHGGIMSTQEALWYGKPMIGIPFFADQKTNIGNSIKFKVAEVISYKDITKENFKSIIMKVLSNPSYTENAQKISKMFQDQPERPLERAVWWIEYILRNPNPEHLQSPTIKLGYIASNGFDILLLVICLVLTLIYLCFKLTRLVIPAKGKQSVTNNTKKVN